MEKYDVSLEGEEEEGEGVVVQEGGRGEPPPEESKLSRLFYLQLYSSVLNAEKAHKKREKERKRKERRSLKLKLAKKKVVKSLSWMDVTNLLARSFSTEGSTRDKDIGDVEVVTEVAIVGGLLLIGKVSSSCAQDVMVDRRISVGRGQYLPQTQVASLTWKVPTSGSSGGGSAVSWPLRARRRWRRRGQPKRAGWRGIWGTKVGKALSLFFLNLDFDGQDGQQAESRVPTSGSLPGPWLRGTNLRVKFWGQCDKGAEGERWKGGRRRKHEQWQCSGEEEEKWSCSGGVVAVLS